MILSANIGDFDPKINHECRVVTFTEKNLPYPLPNLNNRLRGKYIKIQTHRFCDEPEFIWIDGSVQVTNRKFGGFLRDKLQDADIAIPLHPDRNNVYDELNYILDGIKNGKDYLKERYVNEPLTEEQDFYRMQGLPADFPLFACRIFARQNSEKVNMAFNDWWMGCLEYSNFDQTYFSYIAWKHDLKIASFPYSDILSYVRINRHNNDNRPPL